MPIKKTAKKDEKWTGVKKAAAYPEYLDEGPECDEQKLEGSNEPLEDFFKKCDQADPLGGLVNRCRALRYDGVQKAVAIPEPKRLAEELARCYQAFWNTLSTSEGVMVGRPSNDEVLAACLEFMRTRIYP